MKLGESERKRHSYYYDSSFCFLGATIASGSAETASVLVDDADVVILPEGQ